MAHILECGKHRRCNIGWLYAKFFDIALCHHCLPMLNPPFVFTHRVSNNTND